MSNLASNIRPVLFTTLLLSALSSTAMETESKPSSENEPTLKYTDIEALLNDRDGNTLKSLKFPELLAMVKSDKIKVDSEQSVFLLIVLWIYHDKEARIKHLEELMSEVRFSQTTKIYQENVVKHVLSKMGCNSEKFPAACSNSTPRAPCDGPKDQLSVGFVFSMSEEMMKKFLAGERSRSAPIYKNGYTFFVLIKTEPRKNFFASPSTKKAEYLQLACFVRCGDPTIANKPVVIIDYIDLEFKLPLRFRVIANEKRKYEVVTKKKWKKNDAVGGSLQLEGESFADVMDGTSPLLAGDIETDTCTLPIRANFKFLDPADLTNESPAGSK